ncbi:hypothetical protein KV205_33845 [Streptomyces sp. SKN60]|uniref:hypothetical protein n=1 Tax=Streptomyces sp. SKN60 TaxID=2855506 RepID=UPI002246E75A|nr:hypothetical protein [Streptomyces sp. SKN60]MCX2185456.1 hypothetical protein [Streptomyces sp. SKN60]
MEQRTGPSSIQAVQGAAADPAFVPGITGLAPVKQVEEPEDVVEPQDAVPASALKEPEAAEADSDPDTDPDTDPDAEAVSDGPVFEAADRRARIVADATGVQLSLDEENCEFRWDEIGAVETEVSRFGRRFTVIVHTPDRRWYPIEIDAPAKARVAEWESELDAVLDAYFDEGDAKAS